MRMNHSIIIRLTAEQLEKVKKKSERVGMSISDFTRFLLLKTNIKEIKINVDDV